MKPSVSDALWERIQPLLTALTTARERGAEIIDLQDFAGHADPRTTLTYIRTRDRLAKSPAYVLNY